MVANEKIISQPMDENKKLILVAEDSSITQDLLKLVLNQHGHEVDIVSDGAAALASLEENNYDIALLDFHLPEMDGVQVVSKFLERNSNRQVPFFGAITSDIEGLLQHEENCEKFDKIFPKPVNIQDICSVVNAAHASERPAQTALPSGSPTVSDRPVPTSDILTQESKTSSSPVFSLDYEFLCWPDDLNSKHLSARALQASLSHKSIDAIVIKKRAHFKDIISVWQTNTLHLLPIIDLTGSLGSMADLDCSALGFNELDEVKSLIEAFHDRRAYIHQDLQHSKDIGEKLLGRIFVTNKALSPHHDGRSELLASYNLVLDPQIVVKEAQKLVERGFLSADFFDRVHVCSDCGSSHFNIREECPQCRSSHLREETYLHHFQCAYQGPESDFRKGDDLICPKCRRELRHFGHDYDKPGTMVVCQSCGHATSEPMVGFKCLSCGSHMDGDAIQTRDIHSYSLTEQAIGYIEAGQAFLGFAQQTLRFSELPLELVVSLNDEAKSYNEGGASFALLDISYQNEREIIREYGPRQFNEARQLILDNLHSALPENAKIVKGHAYDFALLKNKDPDDMRGETTDLVARVVEEIRFDIGLVITVFGPEDLSG